MDRTWRQGTWRVNNPKLKDLAPVRRKSTGDLFVPVKEDPQAKDGKLKRTLTRIYTTVPKKIARTKEENDETDRMEQMEEEIEYMEDTENVENFSKCWPKDWLPQDCPNVRVLGVNYTTDVLWRPMWQKIKAR